MANELRETGLDILGALPWGAHFCLFYETEQDLLDTLVPYFKVGLSYGEYCLWIVSAPMTEERAKTELGKAVSQLDRHLAERNIEFVSQDDWFLQEGAFDRRRVFGRWREKLQQAMTRGYQGMRFSGPAPWLQKRDWGDFREFEKDLVELIANQRMMVCCTFPLACSGFADILDVARMHLVALVMRNGAGEVGEPMVLKQAKAEFNKQSEELEQRVQELTRGLSETKSALGKEIAQREAAEESLHQVWIHVESILASVADVHILFDQQWRYLYVNKAAARAMGKPSEEIVGRTLWEMYPDIAGTELEQQYRRAMDGIAVAFEFYYPTTDTWWENRFYPSQEGLSVFATDITQRKKAEEALRESEKRFRSYFHLGLVGTAITSPDKSFLAVSDKLCEIYGYQREELLQISWVQLVHRDYLVAEFSEFERVQGGEIEGYEMESRHIRKDGTIIWVTLSVKCVRRPDRSVEYFVAHLQDVTERKLSEEKIMAYQKELRSMASELSFVEERERRKIATALHDQVGQSLALANLKLGSLRRALPSALGAQIDEIRGMITQAINDSRTLTSELSPPVLYELGLEAAIRTLADRYQREHGVNIQCRDDGQTKHLSDDMRGLLFHGVRELLVNAIKHAHPSNVVISCQREGDDISIVVEDDGSGFPIGDGPTVAGKTEGFGLFSVRERLKYLGGSITIDSATGRGTRVTLKAPLARSAPAP